VLLTTGTADHDETAESSNGVRPRIRAMVQADAARSDPGNDEPYHAVASGACGYWAVLRETGQRPAVARTETHAADLFPVEKL